MIVHIEKEVKPDEWIVVLTLGFQLAMRTLGQLRHHNEKFRYRLAAWKTCAVTDNSCAE